MPFNKHFRGLDASSRKLACADTLNGILVAYESFPNQTHIFNDALDSHLRKIERDQKLRNRELLNIGLREKIAAIKDFYKSIHFQPRSNNPTWKYQQFFLALSVGNLKRTSDQQALKIAG